VHIPLVSFCQHSLADLTVCCVINFRKQRAAGRAAYPRLLTVTRHHATIRRQHSDCRKITSVPQSPTDSDCRKITSVPQSPTESVMSDRQNSARCCRTCIQVRVCICTYEDRHSVNGVFSRTTWVSRHQKG